MDIIKTNLDIFLERWTVAFVCGSYGQAGSFVPFWEGGYPHGGLHGCPHSDLMVAPMVSHCQKTVTIHPPTLRCFLTCLLCKEGSWWLAWWLNLIVSYCILLYLIVIIVKTLNWISASVSPFSSQCFNSAHVKMSVWNTETVSISDQNLSFFSLGEVWHFPQNIGGQNVLAW